MNAVIAVGPSPIEMTELADRANSAAQHLAKVQAEGLATTRQETQTLYYRLEDPAASQVLEAPCGIYRKS